MLKGYRTYIAAIGGVLTGLGLIANAVVNGDYSNVGEALTMIFVSAAQGFQRAAIT